LDKTNRFVIIHKHNYTNWESFWCGFQFGSKAVARVYLNRSDAERELTGNEDLGNYRKFSWMLEWNAPQIRELRSDEVFSTQVIV